MAPADKLILLAALGDLTGRCYSPMAPIDHNDGRLSFTYTHAFLLVVRLPNTYFRYRRRIPNVFERVSVLSDGRQNKSQAFVPTWLKRISVLSGVALLLLRIPEGLADAAQNTKTLKNRCPVSKWNVVMFSSATSTAIFPLAPF